MAFTHSPKIVTDGLVVLLDAGNPRSYTGSIYAFDLSGNRYTATGSTSNMSYSSSFGGAFNLNNRTPGFIGFQISPSNYTPINFQPNNSFTLAIWAKIDTIQSQSGGTLGLFGKGSAAGSVGIGVENLGTPTFKMGSRITGSGGVTAPTIPIQTGSIYYATFVYTPTSQSVYVNGEFKSAQATSASANGQFSQEDWRVFTFATIPGGNNSTGSGQVYNASIYNRELTAREVLQNFNAMRGRFGI